jgi:glycosyltransferase involved in cell wall biosynthesis
MTSITIGIPTKNRASMLAELLEDIEKYQSDIPIVISDNSDRDDTANLIDKYSGRLKIKYIHTKNSMSQAENFNILLKNASTKYVVMIHDDDRLLPTSLDTYLSIVNYLEISSIDVFGVYVHAYKFKNYQELNKLQTLSLAILDLADIQENLRVFQKGEYQKYFVENGIGGKAPGVLVNRSLMEINNIYFPTDTGAKHDKAFFLTANAVGSIGCWTKKIIAQRLHESRSIHKDVTKNYRLFNQKILELYEGDDLSIRKIHKKRFEKWMQAEPRFKPIECCSLILSSKLDFFDILYLLGKYLFYYLISKRLVWLNN